KWLLKGYECPILLPRLSKHLLPQDSHDSVVILKSYCETMGISMKDCQLQQPGAVRITSCSNQERHREFDSQRFGDINCTLAWLVNEMSRHSRPIPPICTVHRLVAKRCHTNVAPTSRM